MKISWPIIALIVLVVGGGVYLVMQKTKGTAATPATNFEECVAEGNPVMESYPRMCRSKDGRLFTEEVAEQPVHTGGDARIGDPVSEGGQASDEASVEGRVTLVDLEGMAVDGPGKITVATADGSVKVIAIPSMGINLCAAKDDIASVSEVTAGDTVSARGAIGPDGEIVPCEKSTHYFRIGVQ